MPDTTNSFWTQNPEAENEVKLLWNAGYSANQILKQLGHPKGLSRCAVIGKIHRLGLRRADHVRTKPVKPKKPKMETIKVKPRKPLATNGFAHHEPPKDGTLLIDLPIEATATAVSLYDAQPDQCRWVIDTMTYCGAPVAQGVKLCYCSTHYNRAVQPAYRNTQNDYKPFSRWR